MSNILNKYEAWSRDLVLDTTEQRLEMAEFFRRYHLHWIFCKVHANSTCRNNQCIFAALTWQFARRNGLQALAASLESQLPTNPAQQRQFSTVWKHIESAEKLDPLDFHWGASRPVASARMWFGSAEMMSKL